MPPAKILPVFAGAGRCRSKECHCPSDGAATVERSPVFLTGAAFPGLERNEFSPRCGEKPPRKRGADGATPNDLPVDPPNERPLPDEPPPRNPPAPPPWNPPPPPWPPPPCCAKTTRGVEASAVITMRLKKIFEAVARGIAVTSTYVPCGGRSAGSRNGAPDRIVVFVFYPHFAGMRTVGVALTLLGA